MYVKIYLDTIQMQKTFESVKGFENPGPKIDTNLL